MLLEEGVSYDQCLLLAKLHYPFPEVATGLENVNFHSNPKEMPFQRMFKHHTIALISHISKVILKILQARLQLYMSHELPDVQAGFRKAEEPEIKLLTSVGSSKEQEGFRKTSTSPLFTMQTVWTTSNWKILKEMGMPDHLTCLLRNLYAGQEATVRLFPNWERNMTGVYNVTVLL